MGLFDWLWGYEDEKLYFPWHQPPPIPDLSAGPDLDEGRHKTKAEIDFRSDQSETEDN